jgi:GT2 family glycosyltransferase
MRLAAVVVNFRTPDETLRALASLRQSRRVPDDVVVVDNGSGDGSFDRLRAFAAGARVFAAADNLGFSGGCNVGIREALARGAELVLLVNSDAVLPADCIERLERALTGRAGAGIAAPVLLGRDDPDHVMAAGIRFSALTGRMRLLAVGAPHRPRPTAEVDAVSGCVMLIARAVLERVGLLDEAYFFSFEDVDFCRRARRAGFVSLCVGDAVALHDGSGSIGRQAAARLYFASRNHLRVAARTAPAGRVRGALRAGGILGLNLLHALFTAEAPRRAGVGAVLQGAWHHARGRYGPGPA